MKTAIERYPKKHRTMQSRFIYVLFSRYEKLSKVAELLNVSRQYVFTLLKTGEIPLIYASFLADKHGEIPVGLFNYTQYVLIKGMSSLSYIALLEEVDWLSDVELDYIVKAKPMETPYAILKTIWKKTLKPYKRKKG